MTEPITLLSHDALDELVDVDPIKLRDEAFKMRAEVERLRAELGANRQRWYHLDRSRTECVAGHDPETRQCAEGGGAVISQVEYLTQLVDIWQGLTRKGEEEEEKAKGEADRLKAQVEELTALLNDPDRLAEHLRELRKIVAPGTAEIARVTAQEYHATRDDVTGRVELRIGGPEGTVVIDLGEDGDEILTGLLDIGQDDEGAFDDEDDDLAETCGDCMTGRCHGDGPCGCARHDASVEAAQERAR